MNWFITGVSSGLGLAIATAAINRGDFVAGTVRKSENKARFEALSPKALGLIADVTDADSIAKAVSDAEAASGGIDAVVNNAGCGLVGAIEETSLAEVRALYEVNVFGALNVIHAALPYMRARRRGHILNITSVSGYSAWVGTGIYASTKYALEGIGRTLANEVEELGIKVTNIAPGGFRTAFASGLNVVKSKISDYDGAARQSEHIMKDHQGHEPGDPARAAQAILCIAGADEAPVRLLLGQDALGYAENHMRLIQADIAKWRDLSLSTAFA